MKRVLIVLCVLLVAIPLCLFLLIPWYVPQVLEARLPRLLEERGIMVHKLEVHGFSHRDVSLANLSLGAQNQVQIGSIRVGYSLGSLLGGRVEQITIARPLVCVDAQTGFSTEGLIPESKGAPSSIPLELPFDRVDIHGGLVLVAGCQIPFKAHLSVLDGGMLNVTCSGGGVDVLLPADSPLTGLKEVAGDLSFVMKPDLEITRLNGRLSAEELRLDAQSLHSVSVKCMKVEGSGNLDYAVELRDRSVFGASFSNASGRITGLFDVKPGELAKNGLLDVAFKIDGLAVTNSTTTLSLPEITLHSEIRLSEEGVIVEPPVVRLDGGSFSSPPHVALSGISAEALLPVTPPGKVSVAFGSGSVSLHDNLLPGLKGRAVFLGDTFSSQIEWPALSATGGTIRLSATLAEGGGTYELDPIALVSESELGIVLQSIAGGALLDGEVSARGSLGRNPTVHLELRDLQVKQKKYAVEGLSGSIEFSSLSPLSTPSAQTLTVRRLDADKLVFSNGVVRLQVENEKTVFVETCDWRFLGGRASMFSTRFNLKKPAFETTLYVNNLELGSLMDALMGDRLAGAGRFNGAVPVRIKLKPFPFISPVGGFLYSQDETGSFQVTDSALLDTVVESSTAGWDRSKATREVKDRLRLSLKDMEYDKLKIEFNDTPLPTGQIHVVGKGRGERGIPLNITIRINAE